MADFLRGLQKLTDNFTRTFAKKRDIDVAPSIQNPVQEGVLTPAVCAMLCDGQEQPTEFLQLYAMLKMSPIFEGLTEEKFCELLAVIKARLKSGVEAQKLIREATQPLSTPLKETAYAFALRMLFVDKSLHMSELHFRDNVGTWIGVQNPVAGKIRETMEIMARPSTA